MGVMQSVMLVMVRVVGSHWLKQGGTVMGTVMGRGVGAYGKRHG